MEDNVIYNNDKAIAAAFIKARAAIGGTVTKDAKGNFGKYATLAAITDVITGPLAAHGLAVIQEAQLDEHGVTVETTLLHESGATMQFAALTMPLSNRTPQAVGSALTYGRRYALAAICGLAPDDDDGQAAEDAHKAPQRNGGTPAPKQTTSTPKTPQGAPTQATGKPKATPEQLAEIERLGAQVYPTEWAANKSKIADLFSRGACTQLEDLLESEAAKAIKGLEKKLEPIAH